MTLEKVKEIERDTCQRKDNMKKQLFSVKRRKNIVSNVKVTCENRGAQQQQFRKLTEIEV